jgi:hypothetical protein
MSAIVDKERLVSNVVRLTRAERKSSAQEDIAAVRLDLERAIGPTVTRAMAARLLGVSQTALDRWISLGDIPAVIGRTGRREVPLHALVELVDAIEDLGRSGKQAHPLAHLMRQRRRQAQRLDANDILWDIRYPHGEHDHRGAELRGLAYHRLIARRLNRAAVRRARDRLERWRSEGRIAPRYALAWEQILSESPARIASLIGEDSERMRDLRQSSPFAGALTEPERRALFEALDAATQ